MGSVATILQAAGHAQGCPVERIGRELAQLTRVQDRIEARWLEATEDTRPEVDAELQACFKRRMALEEQASWLTPQTLAGAMVLIGIAHSQCGVLHDMVPGDEAAEEGFERMRWRAARCLDSAYRLIAEVSGVDPKALDSGFYMCPGLMQHAWKVAREAA